MGEYLSTDIASPQVVAVGGQLTGNFATKAPTAGFFYLLVEQYTSALVLIPGSRAFLYQPVVGGPFINSTVNYAMLTALVAGEEDAIPAVLTLPNTDCLLYVSLKEIAGWLAIIPAGAFVVGTTYKILTIGTTDFTLVGAVSNTVGIDFVATGVGAGTGTACATPDPDTDDTIDYVVITLTSAAPAVGGINMGELMNLMITMMIVVMMMKMMMSTMQSV